MLHPGLVEACLLHPSHAVDGGVVEAAVGLDHHVQAHQQPESVLPARVVDDRLVNDERTTLRQGVIRLGDQQALLLQVLVVQDMSHHQHVGPGQQIGKEVARVEGEPVR